MAELNETEWELDGLQVGSSPFVMLRAEGLDDTADVSSESIDRLVEGQAPSAVRLVERGIKLTIGLSDPDADDRDDLRAACSPSADRSATKVLRWRHNDEVTKRLAVQPDGQALTFPGDVEDLQWNMPVVRVALIARDPVIYSDAETTTTFSVSSGGTDTDSVTNAGTLTALSPGGLWWQITAAVGGCVDPWFRLASHTDETWRLVANLSAGEVVTVGYDRVTRRGTTIQSANVRGPASSPVPIWPALRPGAQNVTFGCTSGGFTATLKHRSTW